MSENQNPDSHVEETEDGELHIVANAGDENIPAGVDKPRRIKSYALRCGRMSDLQKHGLRDVFLKWGLTHDQGPLSQQERFGREANMVLEIGFGMGQSLLEMAKNNPETNYVGIEVHKPGVGSILAEAEKQGIENLRIYCHDAIEILADCIADESLDRVQLFFPDPWHKKRHHKRRIVKPEFIEQLRSKLKIGGVFHMATDWENYAEHMMEEMSEAPGFTNACGDKAFSPRPDYRPYTKFERRGERLGHGVWDLLFERID